MDLIGSTTTSVAMEVINDPKLREHAHRTTSSLIKISAKEMMQEDIGIPVLSAEMQVGLSVSVDECVCLLVRR